LRKRLFLVAMAGLLLLSGCEREVVLEEGETTTAEAMATRTVVPSTEYPLGDGRVVVEPSHFVMDDKQKRIVLRDKNGTETILLGPEMHESRNNSYRMLVPFVGIVLNDRYFTFSWVLPESCASNAGYVYDIQLRRVIALEIDPDMQAYPVFKDGVLYYYHGWSEEGEEPIFQIDLRDLDEHK